MIKINRNLLFLLILGFSSLCACQRIPPIVTTSGELLQEAPVQEITLLGPSARANAEISGLAWCGNALILLPQYPQAYGERDSGAVFSISKAAIDAFLAGEMDEGIQPDLVPFDSAGMEQSIEGFEGFESIVFEGERFYVVIEARQDDGMVGYLAQGHVEEGCSGLMLDPTNSMPISAQADLRNITDETLVYWHEQLYTIYEANGENVNPNAVAHVFAPSLTSSSTIRMVNVPYRITDATEADTEGLFWAINYFFPGDLKLKPPEDILAQTYGVGKTHQQHDQVERLLAFMIAGDEIALVDQHPIYLELSGTISRNWEGIVRYEDGFLLVTDLYPRTILAYVENISPD